MRNDLGPSQTARSVQGTDRRQIAWINQRHITEDAIYEAITTVINAYNNFALPRLWGSGKRASADGTRWDLYEQKSSLRIPHPLRKLWRHISSMGCSRTKAISNLTHIDSLFGKTINWTLIETHFPDMLRVVLSIKAGRISSSILRRLGTYSRKNRLYQAFWSAQACIRSTI
ncbi:Tn3 family transposase [Edaphobacter modestus]|uniref:Tn3 family transposase n=1 Tax=Edaphobacter modestus TaxID=388466 RepID=UPI0024158656|nr:Tn3 family transposase [Edaphobacter modestus]